LVTVLAVTASLVLLRPLLARRQLFDVPNHRSSHTTPTLRGGGVGIATGLLVGLGVAAVLAPANGTPGIAAVSLAVVALAAVGFAEDLRGLPVSVRLLAQLLSITIPTVGLVLLAGLPMGLGVLVALAGVFYVNTANFMDGVNGISGMHGLVVGAYFAAVGFIGGDNGLMLAAIAVGAAFLSFLPWNVPRARMFMGDVGSYALGGAAWALSAVALALGVNPVTAVAPLLVYAADVTLTLARRAARRAALTQAHREHVYQQVEQLTHSHPKAAGLVTASTLACAGIGLWNLLAPGVALWAIAGMASVLVLYLATPFLTRRHDPSASRDSAAPDRTNSVDGSIW
jgi:UDP-N-acetylmuramyl pentapeptide phosphotransferase/UDP-N-acetylglucosamine-1-phosphate transferase